MNKLRILACQVAVPATRTEQDRDAHVERCADEIRRRLDAAPADLVVLPELSSIDYSRASFDRLDRIAEPLDGSSFRIYRELSTHFGVTVVYGIARTAGNACAITQAAVGPEGILLGHYDKLHIAQFGASMEKDYFAAGDHLLTLNLGGFRVAPIICYDIRIPELARTLCLRHGVDLILHCGAYFRDESFPTWHAFVTTRAVENQCFVLSLNRAGEHYGDSLLCPPWTCDDNPPLSFSPRDEEFRLLDIDTGAITEAKARYPFLRDRLDDYGNLECVSVRV
jgi:nitrilase